MLDRESASIPDVGRNKKTTQTHIKQDNHRIIPPPHATTPRHMQLLSVITPLYRRKRAQKLHPTGIGGGGAGRGRGGAGGGGAGGG
ncbi:hypothetical protein ELQ93_13535 [Labedella gwakjiensis]|uniref:Uncharacterized protein n=1 Tax=Labedella gwakjiensis TaxID=390269 RepID=A0ABY0C5B3_9MICO|nr:hypothetical protein ELQ93_13535 [Labedella gwakjiensis]